MYNKRGNHLTFITFKGHGHGPKVRGAIDIPLGMARRLGRKGAVPIVAIVGMAVAVVAAMANVGMGMLLVAKEVVYPIPHLPEEVSEAHGGRQA